MMRRHTERERVMTLALRATSASDTYTETRSHELRKSRMLMIDGHLAVNARSVEGGVSARIYQGGYWGFASTPGGVAASARVERVRAKAAQNARAMARFGARTPLTLPGATPRGDHAYAGRPPLAQKECMER